MNDELEHQLQLQQKAQEKTSEQSYVDPSDGTKYEWDEEKRAWFPKIDQDFLATYLSNYGEHEVVNSSSTKDSDVNVAANTQNQDPDDEIPDSDPKQGEKRKANESQGWFEVEDQHNTNVYVSGLPGDISEEEFIELMSKYGIIMKDQDAKKLKVKLYSDSHGNLKGDALCCYIKVESVELVLNLLDESDYRGHKIHVERAKFQMKGDYDPKKRPKKKKNKDKQKQKKVLDKLLDWKPELSEFERSKCETTVILKNMFDISEFDKDAKLILEYQTDLREECAKFGEVKKVKVYDRHPDGVASITFKLHEEADNCISVMNGRWFGGRQLSAETWDGKTKYVIHESEEELEARMKKWDDYLENH